MTVYNGEEFLSQQLDSILRQTHQNIELVICDDCSQDGSLNLIAEYAAKDNRIRFFKNDENLGYVKNFAKAISFCKGDFIAMADQDDVWSENHIEVLLENIGGFDLIGANAELVDEKLKPLGNTMLQAYKRDFLPQTQEEWFFFLLHANVFQGTATLFRRSLLEKALPLPEGIRFHDWWLALIAASGENGVKYTPECLLRYRQHGTNQTENEKWNTFKKIREALFTKKHLKKETAAQKHIVMLKALLERLQDEKQRRLTQAALKFSQGQLSFFKARNIPYYIRNYKRMFLSSNKKLFLMRFIKNFVLGR